jgi:hypothetical protein
MPRAMSVVSVFLVMCLPGSCSLIAFTRHQEVEMFGGRSKLPEMSD